MKQILCSLEVKVGTNPFHSSHIPPKNPRSQIKLILFHPPDEKPGGERKLLFFSIIKKKTHSKNIEGGLEVSETANESWSINI